MIMKMVNAIRRLLCLRYVRTLVNNEYTGEYAEYVFSRWKTLNNDHLFQIVESLE